MALSPVSLGGADPAYTGGPGVAFPTRELTAQANRLTPSPDRSTAAASPRTAINDPVSLSAAAQQLSDPASAAQSSSAAKASQPGEQLSDAEQKQVAELKKRDREVRQHEQAHQAAGGQYASAPSYSFQQGPDGKQYAVGGEVQIDASPIPGDPAATIEKMRVVKAAALAPAEPSGQDRKVAAAADAAAQQARAEQAAQDREEREAVARGDAPSDPSQPSTGPQSPDTQSPFAGPSAEQADGQAAPFGFSGGAQPAQINQANGAYSATTRAQSVSQLVGLVA
ncbi:putative metalloprotease CJM1_0395 family protein [Oceanicaulis sp.]|uniref:putative metalloprotease CJM1_0395 family protein n=1 Tax=Oceanicaulis sp. TaxID=1924941 RepID=UPI003F6EBDDA